MELRPYELQIIFEVMEMEEPSWWSVAIGFHPFMQALLLHVRGVQEFDVDTIMADFEYPVFVEASRIAELEYYIHNEVTSLAVPEIWPRALNFHSFMMAFMLHVLGVRQFDPERHVLYNSPFTPITPLSLPDRILEDPDIPPIWGWVMIEVLNTYTRPPCWPTSVNFQVYMWALLMHIRGIREFNIEDHLSSFAAPDPLLIQLGIVAYRQHILSEIAVLETPTDWPQDINFHIYILRFILNVQAIIERDVEVTENVVNPLEEAHPNGPEVWNPLRLINLRYTPLQMKGPLAIWVVVLLVAYIFFWVDFNKFRLALPVEHESRMP